MAPQRTANQPDFAFEVGSYTEKDLRVVGFSGSEAVSELFSFELELAAEDGGIDFDKVVGQPAKLTMFHDDGERHVAGIVRAFEQGGAGIRFTRYYASLVPTVWFLTQRTNNRIFQDTSTPDIVKKVLQDAGISSDGFRFSLQKEDRYKPRNYCVQYRETDFAFVARLLEEEGIGYFFEHGDKGDVLVMGDWSGSHAPIDGKAEVLFREAAALVPGEEYISAFKFSQAVRPGKASLKDYAFKKPGLSLESISQGKKNGALEVYDYPGEYVQADLGDKLAKVRLEEMQATQRLGGGDSTCRRFVPGYCFTLADHGRSEFNAEHLLVRVLHTGVQQQALEEEGEGSAVEAPPYYNQFECVPSDVPFRPARVTPHPVVGGVQTATVVGPDGEEIYCDEYGRIKVQFHWDRQGKDDDKSSCWVRVGYPWAGNQWGFISIPRIGQEVIVNFLEGDPDRPIVIGSVYNADQMPPYKLPDQQTKSTWKSYSSKGGGGFNEIRFEDKKGSEQVFVHAQKNQDNRVENDSLEWIGHDRHLIVKEHQFEKVEGDKHLTVKGDRRSKIEGNDNETINGDHLVSIAGSDDLTITGDQKVKADGNVNLKASQNLNEEAGMKISIKAGMDFHEKAGMNYAMDAGMAVHIKGGMTVVIEGGLQVSLKAGPSFVDIGPSGVSISGPMVMINSGGAAASGSGSSPTAPDAPDSPEAPKEPKEADKADAGKESKPAKADSYGPQAMALKQRHKSGAPFCKKCEEAKKRAAAGATA